MGSSSLPPSSEAVRPAAGRFVPRASAVLGPLPLELYQSLLPGGRTANKEEGTGLAQLRRMVRFYAGVEMDFVLTLFLDADQAPPMELPRAGSAHAPRLGWTSWLAADGEPAVPPPVLDGKALRVSLFRDPQIPIEPGARLRVHGRRLTPAPFRNPLHPELPAQGKTMYGDKLQIYGNKTCQICNRVHDSRYWIRETSNSRFRLMQLLFELKFDALAAQGGLRGSGAMRRVPTDPNQEDRMLGILTTPLRNYAVHSGDTRGGATPFLQRALGRGYTICPPRSAAAGGRTDINGGTVTSVMYSGSQRAGGYKPGACAAPRLVQQAIEDHIANGRPIDLSQWAMSEVMFRRNPSMSPKGGGVDWVHGLTAHSCATCDALLPPFLCSDDAMAAFRLMFA